MDTRAKSLLTSLFEAAIKAADPLEALASHLPAPPKGRTVVIGAGKGAAQMAAALEQLWEAPLTGTVVTRYGFGAATQHIKVLEASHPVPDAAGLTATEALLAELTTSPPTISLLPLSAAAALPCSPRPLMVSHWKTNKR